MKALILKELVGMAVFLLAGAFCVATAILDGGTGGAWHMWVEPRFRHAEILMGIGLIGGFLLGFAAFFGEQVHRTFEYLAHRPMSLGRIVAAKFLACATVLLAWLLVPIVLQFLLYGLWDPALHLYEPGRIGIWLSLWTLSFSATAAGCFVGTLRAHPVFRLLLAGILLLALLGSSFLLMAPRGGIASPVPFAVHHLIAASLLCLACWWTLREGADPDLPASLGRAALTATLLAISLVLAGGLGIAGLQDELRRMLYGSYPSMARTADGELVLRDWVPEEGLLLFDRHHVPVPGSGDAAAEAISVWHPSEQPRPVYSPRWSRWDLSWISDSTGFFGQHRWLENSVEVAGTVHDASAYYSLEDRLVRLYVYGDRYEGFAPRVVTLGKGSDGEPFAGDLILRQVDEGEHLLVDRGDGSLWLLRSDRLEEGFAPVSLPDGDTFAAPVDLEGHAGDAELSAWPWLDRNNLDLLVRGNNGLYVWRDGSFVRAPEPLIELAKRYEDEDPPVLIVKTDLITPAAELLGEDGRVVGRHEYRPHRFTERIDAGLIYGLSLLRAPVLQIASFAGDHHPLDLRLSLEGGNAELIDPLIAGSRHPLTLLLGILLAAACAGSAVLRLRRLGAPRPRLILWGGLLLLGGPLVLVAYYTMERRRAWRTTPVQAADDAPEMLLRTESAAAR